MASTDAILMPTKNTAYRVTYPIFDNTGEPVPSPAGLDSQVSIDGGSFAACTNEWTEIGSSGIGYLDLTSGEMNGDTIVITTTSSTTDSKTSVIVLYPNTLSVVQIGANAGQVGGQTASASGTVTFPNATLASTTNITAGTITTATNLTNAPTSGDFTATMKSSLNAATPASVVGAVGSVTGNVGGNVVGSVGSVTGLTNSTIAAATRDVNNTSPAANSLGAAVNNAATAADVPTADQNADALLARNISGGSSSGHIVSEALQFLRNKWTLVGTTLTVYEDDGTTVSWTATVGTNPSAEPVVSSSPS